MVEPGYIETDMTRGALDADARARVAAATPLRRLGTPAEVRTALLTCALRCACRSLLPGVCVSEMDFLLLRWCLRALCLRACASFLVL